MRPSCAILTAAIIFSSGQSVVSGFPKHAEIDPENYVSKGVPQEIAEGGIQKLYESGVLRFMEEFESTVDNELESREFARSRNLRSGSRVLQTRYDDDQVLTEYTLTIEYYQDNRFSNPEPILGNSENPTRTASGNRWLYANVPLQPIFGINDLPIEGLAQGFCSGVNSDQNGFCHFTYEFFDLQGGAIVVYASITAEGTTEPQGPSTLTVTGGTGDFAGAVGELTLWPISIDEQIVPARISRDGSLFLGNRNGYEAKFVLSVRELLNPPPYIPVPASQPVAAPTSPNQGVGAASAPLPDVQGDGGAVTAAVSYSSRVSCPNEYESEYCDCALDCESITSTRCSCALAQECCNTQ